MPSIDKTCALLDSARTHSATLRDSHAGGYFEVVVVSGPGFPRKHRFEGAHKLDAPATDGTDGADGAATARSDHRRSINEAGHKLDYRTGLPRPALTEESEDVRKRFAALADSNRDVIAHASKLTLAVGALGIVYGDIGTSPLYTEQTIFTSYHATKVIS